MKTNWKPIKAILGAGLLVSASTFGQTNYTWTGAANGTNLATAGNWNPIGLPSGQTSSGGTGISEGDTARWDGASVGPVNCTFGGFGSLPGTGFGSLGINLHITSNQTSPVQIRSVRDVSPLLSFHEVIINEGAGAFTLGDDNTPNNLFVLNRPLGGINNYVNNSTSPATMGRSLYWADTAPGHTFAFSGTGDWIVNSYLAVPAFSPNVVQVDGPGTMFWTAGRTNAYTPFGRLGTVIINGGKLIIRSSGLFNTQGLPNQPITNNATFVFDAPADAQPLSGVISGAGLLVVSNGMLTLGGASVYTGNTLLAGGTMVVDGPETPGVSGPLGKGGTITFAGGTLGYSPDNFWDYSDRFDDAAGQSYRIDTAGQEVTFTNILASSGGTFTKLGAGTLTLAGSSSYSGSTTVSAGKLVFQSTKSGTGDVTVADGSALGLVDTGTPITPATLTLGTSSGCTLEFDNVNSTATAPLSPTALAATGPVTIQINSGTFVTGQSYPLLAWSSGAAPAVSLGTVNGASGNLTTNGNTIQFNVLYTTYVWNGTNGDNWTASNNWLHDGTAATYSGFGSTVPPVQFDDTAQGTTSVTVDALVQPASITVLNSAKAYTISSSGGNNIAGNTGLTKSGSGTLTLAGGANTYTGVTKVSGGMLSIASLADGGFASDIGQSSSAADRLVLDGGTLQYTGPGTSMDRSFTLTTSGGAIDSSGAGVLNLDATTLGYIGSTARLFTLAGVNTGDNTLAAIVADNGGPTALTKSGVGKWVLTGSNTYSGTTTIGGGTLQIGMGGTSGALGIGPTVNNGSLVFDRTGSLTVSSAISGPGTVTKNGSGTVVLSGSNSYAGLTTINAGRLQINGSVASSSDFVNHGDLFFNNSSDLTLDSSSSISGNGDLIKSGSARLTLRGQESYNGYTLINSGATLQIAMGSGGSFSGTGWITNNGVLVLVREDNNVAGITNNITGTGRLEKDNNNPNNGDVTLMGTNDYTGGTRINGGGLTLGDGTTPGAGSIIGNVVMTNYSVLAASPTMAWLTFQRAFDDDITFPGNITGVGLVQQNGFNVVTLTGNNNYSQGIVINFGTLQDGDGGTGGGFSGDLADNGAFIWNRSVDVTYAGTVSGGGAFEKKGAGTLTMTSQDWNNYFGTITITAGKLAIAGFTAPGTTNSIFSWVDVAGGILSPGVGSVSTIDIQSIFTINGGTVVAYLNTATSPSNTFYTALGGIVPTAGTLMLINAGPPLQVDQKFTIFSEAVSGLTVVSPGFTVQNDLATDGSVTVTAVLTLNYEKLANSLRFSWDSSFAGYKLQVQTNTLSVGLSTNWADYPGGSSSPVTVPIDAMNETVFFRLSSP